MQSFKMRVGTAAMTVRRKLRNKVNITSAHVDCQPYSGFLKEPTVFSMSFRQTLPLLTQNSRSKSSKQWISRQFRDPYIKKRLTDPAAYRSRSAFKLLEINDQMGGFLDDKDVRTVVDLGAAPGGWSQVVTGKIGWQASGSAGSLLHADGKRRGGEFGDVRDDLRPSYAPSCEFEEQVPFRSSTNSGQVRQPVRQDYENSGPPKIEDDLLASPSSAHRGRGTIVAVDLLPIDPITGVHIVRGDFLLGSTTEHIRRLLEKDNVNGKADVILSDIAGNISGNTAHDTESSLEICEAVFEFARVNLRSARAIGRRKGGVLLYDSDSFRPFEFHS